MITPKRRNEARSRALMARRQAARLVEQSRVIVWSCESVYEAALKLLAESARRRR